MVLTRNLVDRHPAATVLLAGLLLVLPPAVWQAASWTRAAAEEALMVRAQATLRLALATLRNELGRYETLPRVLAGNPLFSALLPEPRSEPLAGRANGYLERLAQITGASDIYLLDSSGLTLAASNWNTDVSFVGQNFSYRPYFRGAMAGGLGRYYALGTTSGRRGYYFAYPVERDDGIVGALVVKVDVAVVEQSWAEGPDEVLVSDESDVLFMATRPEWMFHTLRRLSTEELSRIARDQQYPLAEIEPLQVVAREPLPHEAERLRVALPGETGAPREFLAQSLPMAETGWNVHVLADTAPVHAQVRTVSVAVGLGMLLLLLAFAWASQRRVMLRQRLAEQDATQRLLEHRVRERTAELEHEIAEHSAAEAELRRTQGELIQASKLSALGQMSAGISHELNQPLAAIRSFADNALVLFERGRSEDARENLSRISQLTERMARIIRNLRTFARKEGEDVIAVSLSAVIEDSLALLERRIAQEGVTVERSLPDHEVWAYGGPVRLQQVVLNVVGNAIDAMQDNDSRHLRIGLAEDDTEVTLSVRDSGTGIAPEVMGDLFVPFFTTKEVNEGLGLGLSISYGIVRGFGGSISASNSVEGGAEFHIRLRRAAPPTQSRAGAA